MPLASEPKGWCAVRRCSVFLLSLLLAVPASAAETTCADVGTGGASLQEQHHRACVPGYTGVVVCHDVASGVDPEAAYVRVCHPGAI